MGNVFYRQTSAAPLTATHAEGIFIYDELGKGYIDACGGAAVTCLGHGHRRVIEAVQAQVEKLGYVHSGFFTNESAERLAEYLVSLAPGDLDHVYYVSSGSEAMEVALKTARQYFVETGQPERSHFISRRQSYHGNSLGALAVGGNLARRDMFDPMFMSVSHISPCYAYRGRQDDETEAEYSLRVANELADEIDRVGAHRVAAFVAEPVIGSTIGAVPPSEGYFKRIKAICDQHGILLILDEVMCGLGRTGTTFACEQENVAPDIVALAKGLGAGYQPIGAVIVSKRIFEGIASGSGSLLNGQTYNGHPVACAAALATQQTISNENLLENVNAMGVRLTDRLLDRFGNHRNIGDIRGRGLFQAMEFVEDRASKRPFSPNEKLSLRLKKVAMEQGLLVYAGNGTADGRNGDHVLLAPPFNLTADEIDEIVNRLGKALDVVLPG